MEEKYFDEWPENSTISWWNDGRVKLNKIIRIVNQWTLDGCQEHEQSKILRHIRMGLSTFATEDKASGWRDVLLEMENYVETYKSDKSNWSYQERCYRAIDILTKGLEYHEYDGHDMPKKVARDALEALKG